MWTTKLVLRHSDGTRVIDGIKIRRGIFQGDTLSPLLFIIAINPVSFLLERSQIGYKIDDVKFSHILYMDDLKTFAGCKKDAESMANIVFDFTTSIGMKFGLDKCKVLSLVRGKIKKCGSITLDEHSVIDEMENTDVYKYLGVLESDNIKHNEMKTITLEKFKKKLKTILKTDLNAKNIMIAINEFVNPVLTYTYGIVNWTEQDIKSADILVRKMLHMNRMFEIRSDVDRLYIPRNNGGRGLVSLWDSFKTTNARLAHFLTNSPSQIITKCSELDKTGQFSINKKAYKFHEQTPIELPKNFHDNSLLKQAKIVAEKTKNALQKQRYEACLNMPQHRVYFKLLTNPKYLEYGVCHG